MSEFRWAQGSIAGVDLNVSGDPVKCVILDPARLRSNRFVNQRVAANGVVYTQGFDMEGRFKKFGVRLDYVPPDMLQQILDAINSAVDSNANFNVDLQDDFQSVSGDCTIDGSDWLSYPDQMTNESFVASVVMRFITQ